MSSEAGASTMNALKFSSSTQAEDYERTTSELGMWVFLVSEAMIFSGLVFCLFAYRVMYPEATRAGAMHLKENLGTLNTAVLLTSSFTLAVAVWAESGRLALSRAAARRLVAITVVLGALFLGIKGYEYVAEYQEGFFPWGPFRWNGTDGAQVRLFFLLYFILTGFHAAHLLVGMLLLTIVCLRGSVGTGSSLLALSGLYWHFVDVIWVFLYPLLYLGGS